MKRRFFWTLLFFLGAVGPVLAQGHEKQSVGFFKRLGNKIDSMVIKGVDPRYIEVPKRPWQVILIGNVNQSIVDMKSTVDGSQIFSTGVGDLKWEPRLKTDPSTYTGIWVGYRGYGFGYSWNVAGDKGKMYTMDIKGGSYGLNIRIHDFKTDDPEVHYAGMMRESNSPSAPISYVENTETMHTNSPIETKTVMIDGYYMFNGKHFSYAAAYDQSVTQKCSAGSFMAGAMFYYSHINYATDDNANFILLMDNIGQMKHWQFGVGAGYAYNFVPCKGLLISAMAMPMVTLYNRQKTWRYGSNLRDLAIDSKVYTEGELPTEDWKLKEEPMSVNDGHSNITLNIDGRLSISYQWSRYFVSAYGQIMDFRFRDGNVKNTLQDWYVNAAFGMRF